MTLQGTRRRQDVEDSLRTGQPVKTNRQVQQAMAFAATVLALATTALIIFN